MTYFWIPFADSLGSIDVPDTTYLWILLTGSLGKINAPLLTKLFLFGRIYYTFCKLMKFVDLSDDVDSLNQIFYLCH